MDPMFLQNQQQLAFKVALLPLLRKEWEDSKQKCMHEFLSANAQDVWVPEGVKAKACRLKYEQCIADIKALAEQM